MRYKWYFFLCLCFFLPFGSNHALGQFVQRDSSQTSPETVRSEELDFFRENPNFDYTVENKEAPAWWLALTETLGNFVMKIFEWIFGVEKAAGAFSIFLKLLPYLLLCVLVFILVKFFLKVNAQNLIGQKAEKGGVVLSEEERIIKYEDINALIDAALKKQDYRLAVRYSYLLLLRTLSEKDLINWAAQKTNDDYQKELKREKLKNPFRQVTHWYNHIWYGDFGLDKERYERISGTFRSIHKSLDHG